MEMMKQPATTERWIFCDGGNGWDCDGIRLMMCASFSPNAKRPNTIYDYFKNAQDNWTKHCKRSASSIHRVHIWYILLFARSVLHSIQRNFPVQNCKRSTLKRWIKLPTLSCRTEQTTTDIPVANVIVLSFVYVVHLTSVPKHSQVCVSICLTCIAT